MHELDIVCEWQDGVSEETDLYEALAPERPLTYKGITVGKVTSWSKAPDGLHLQAWLDDQLEGSRRYFGEMLRRAKAGALHATPAFLRYAGRMSGEEVKSWPWLGVELSDTPMHEMGVWTHDSATKRFETAGLKMAFPDAGGPCYYRKVHANAVSGDLLLAAAKAVASCKEERRLVSPIKVAFFCEVKAGEPHDHVDVAELRGYYDYGQEMTIHLNADQAESQIVEAAAHELYHLADAVQWGSYPLRYTAEAEANERWARGYGEAFVDCWSRGGHWH